MLVETLRNTLNHFEEGRPVVPDEPTRADLNPWRDRIDKIDRVILQLMNERSRCANVIGHLKVVQRVAQRFYEHRCFLNTVKVYALV